MKLYGYWRSSSSWRVRIALAVKNIPYTYQPVHLVKDGGQQYLPDFVAKNPRSEVPVLEFEEGGITRTLAQSVAIMEFLQEKYPEPALLPADALARAQVRQMVEMINSGIQPLQNLAVLQRLQAAGVNEIEWAHDAVKRGAAALEAVAAKHAGTYLFGDSLSLADCCLIPQLYAARRFNVDLGIFTTLLRVEAICAELPAFKAAHADAQIDAPQNQPA